MTIPKSSGKPPSQFVAELLSSRRSVTCLSPREREIVRLVARGLPNKAIAQLLDISLWTVATHVRRVFAKLGVASRAEMVAKILLGEALDTRDRSPGGSTTPANG